MPHDGGDHIQATPAKHAQAHVMLAVHRDKAAAHSSAAIQIHIDQRTAVIIAQEWHNRLLHGGADLLQDPACLHGYGLQGLKLEP